MGEILSFKFGRCLPQLTYTALDIPLPPSTFTRLAMALFTFHTIWTLDTACTIHGILLACVLQCCTNKPPTLTYSRSQKKKLPFPFRTTPFKRRLYTISMPWNGHDNDFRCIALLCTNSLQYSCLLSQPSWGFTTFCSCANWFVWAVASCTSCGHHSVVSWKTLHPGPGLLWLECLYSS